MSGTSPHPGDLAVRSGAPGVIASDGPSGDGAVDAVVGPLTAAVDVFLGHDPANSGTPSVTTAIGADAVDHDGNDRDEPESADGPESFDDKADAEGMSTGSEAVTRHDAAAVLEAAIAAHEGLHARLRQADVG